MRRPIASNTAEIEVKRSRFIAIAEPLKEGDVIKERIAQVRTMHPQANHVVHAAVMGEQGTQYSMSDDREPKNTAGRPILEILKGSNITGILVMVVRYFGGTLLGTGGLVKAYGDAAKAVLNTLKTEELIEKTVMIITIGYDIYEQVKLLLADHEGQCTEDFAVEVTIRCILPSVHVPHVSEKITNLSAGTASIRCEPIQFS